MPKDKNFKKLVRERMAKTGESYVTARSHLLGSTSQQPPPFEVGPMFTWEVAPTVKLAQDEARLRGAIAIRPTHLLLGLLDRGGAAVGALMSMKVSTAAVRAFVERTEPARRSASRTATFHADTQRLFAIAVDESLERGEPSVSDVALLLALASMPGVPREALSEFGASEERLRAELDLEARAPVSDELVRRRVEDLLVQAIGEPKAGERREVLISEMHGRLRVDVHTSRPGHVIGRQGTTADWIRGELESEFGPTFFNVQETKRGG